MVSPALLYNHTINNLNTINWKLGLNGFSNKIKYDNSNTEEITS